jgi:ankyrin repeat protein
VKFGSGHKRVTALHLVAEFGLVSMAKALLNAGFPPDLVDDHLRSPLSWAAQTQFTDFVQLLLENGGVAVDSRDKYGRTPLSYAIRVMRNAEVLISFGANPNSVDKDGCTPFSLAVAHAQGNVAKYFLDHCELTQMPKIWMIGRH